MCVQAIMKRIASREIPTYFELESGLLTGSLITERAALIALLSDPGKGSVLDKSRLLCLITISLCQAGGGGGGSSDYKPTNQGVINSKYVLENAYEDAFITGCMGILQPATAPEGAKADVGVLEQVCVSLCVHRC